MNDDQLVQLLQQKTPEELSLAEIDLLRKRLSESDELRASLFEQLEMEQYLAEALGRVDVSIHAITGGQSPRNGVGPHPVLLLVVGVVCLGLIGFIALVIVAATQGPTGEAVAQADDTSPSADEVEPASDGEAPIDADGTEENPIDDPPVDEPADGAATEEPDDNPPEDVGNPVEDPPKPQGPWAAGLAAPPKSFEKTWHVDFDTEKFIPAKNEIEAWFAKAPGQSCRFYDEQIQGAPHGALQGVAKLKAPWADDAALRFSTSKADLLRIHCYRGERGVSIYWNTRLAAADRWASYIVTRDGDQHAPQQMQLADTDEGRDEVCDARYGPTLLLYWHDGEIVLTRGDVELARARFPDGPPEDVFFEGQAAFRGIEMFRLVDHPPPAEAWPEPYQIVAEPAELEWTGDVPEGAAFEKRDDRAMHLAMDNLPKFGWLAARVPTDRVRFVEVQLEDLEPGAQIWLGPPPVVGADGKIAQFGGRPSNPALTFATNNQDKRLAVDWKARDDSRKVINCHPPEHRAAPLVGSTTWVRFLVGAGWIRCWLSPNGEDWALLNWGEPWASGPLTHLGIGCSQNAAGAKVTVRQIRFRELPSINGLADEEVLKRAKSFETATDYGKWIVAVSQSQPGDIDAERWRIACAVRTLAVGAASPTMQALLDMLLRSRAAEQLSIDGQLALLGEVGLLVSMTEKTLGGSEFNLAGRYHAVGGAQAKTPDARPYTAVRRAMMTKLPQGRHFFKTQDPGLIRVELINLAYAGKWDEVATLVERLKFYGASQWEQVAPLAPWLDLMAARQRPSRIGESVAPMPNKWRNPLVEDYSKEAYNVMAEFHAAVESESYDDASAMIADLDPYSVSGLAPSAGDADLLVCAATAIRSAMTRDAALAEAMNEKYAGLGQLRVRQASAAGDETAVRLATVQFHGTQAAGLAHAWLGDRALSGGEFVQAIAHYRRAEQTLDVVALRQVAPRVRLAGAMLGADVGEPPTTPVHFGQTQMGVDDFEKLVAEMRTTHAGAAALLQEFVAEPAQPAPPPRGYQVHRRGRLDGEPGESPNSIDGHVRQYDVPWLARQLGIVQQGSILYVNNRFHIAAYDLAQNGNRLWQSPPPPNRGRTHDWKLTAMRPVVSGDRIFARQLTKEGPLLICLNRENGQHVWVSKPPREEEVLSDPMLAQGKLFALSLRRTRVGEDQLLLRSYALDTGEPIATHELVGIRESWRQRRVCRATQRPDGLIAKLGGFVLSVGFDGEVRWVRRQLTLPASQEPSWVAQRFDRPLVIDGRALIATPGVRAIECLDVGSGGLLWRSVDVDVERIIGSTGGRLIVYAGDELAALDLQTGERKWATPVSDALDAELCGGEHGVLIARSAPSPLDPNKRCPELIWLTAETGEITARTALPDLTHDGPRFGPLVAHGDRLWSFFGSNIEDPHRDLIELQPQGEPDAENVSQIAAAPDVWLSHTRPELREAVARHLPDWRLLAAANRDGFGHIADAHGEKDVVALPADGASPTIIAREVTVPQSGKPRLRLRFGNEPNQHWRLVVRLGEQVLSEREIEWSKRPEVWKNQTIDLSAVAGQSGWLIIEAHFVAHGDHTRTYWKRLDMQF